MAVAAVCALATPALGTSSALGASATLVKDIDPGGARSHSDPFEFTRFGGVFVFSAEYGPFPFELWMSDGTEPGTQLVKDIYPGARGSLTSGGGFTRFGGVVFFSADDGTHGYELWKSDGTEAGTRLVKDISPGSSYPRWFTRVGDTLFFAASDGTHGYELWKSDGTEAGTQLVKDVRRGSESANTGHWSEAYLTNVGGTLFFGADDGRHGIELWRSDGTRAGTKLVEDIHGVRSSKPQELTKVGGVLFFRARDGKRDGKHGYELWKSRGTKATTKLVENINRGSEDSFPRYLTRVGHRLFFVANDGTHGDELWKSNGHAKRTKLVKDILAGPRRGRLLLTPLELTNVAGTLFFNAYDGRHGYELWKSSGTRRGTKLVEDIRGGKGHGSHPYYLTNVAKTLFFAADDGRHGHELWKSNGTRRGTELVEDIRPGGNGSKPEGLENVAGTLFFAANDGTHGNELWKATP